MTLEDAIAANIRVWRARRGIPQLQIVNEMQALGFTSWYRQTISRVECGLRRVTSAELVALARVFGCTPASLLDVSQLEEVTFPNGKPVGA